MHVIATPCSASTADLERDLSMKFESPRPQSRLRLGPNGIELTIRYPADTRYAVQVADEISRRALDAIAQDPALSLSMPGTPNLSPLARPQPPIVEAAEPESGGEATAASAMVPAGAEVTVQPPSNDPPCRSRERPAKADSTIKRRRRPARGPAPVRLPTARQPAAPMTPRRPRCAESPPPGASTTKG